MHETRDPDTMRLGEQPMGVGRRVVVIAEVGVNHDGSVDDALRLIDAAAEAGANVVKFQMFRAAELATCDAATAAYQQSSSGASQREMLARLELSDEDFDRVASHCLARRVEFLATPFGPVDVGRLQRMGVRAVKIASTDLNNPPLLSAAADLGVPLIVSVGAATPEEISKCVARLRRWGAGERLVLLHCVSCYPTPLEIANLGAIASLRQAFGVPVGFSDHTTSTAIGGWAVAAGACVLEKHFTLDKTRRGPDHAMSLEPDELRAYVETARAAQVALGSGRFGMAPGEEEVRAVARKSVVAAVAIAAGDVIEPHMVTVKRPAGGIEPDQIEAVVGRRAVRDLAPDTLLTWDLLQ